LLPQDPVCRLPEIFGDKVGQARVVEPVNGSRYEGNHTKTAGVIQVSHSLGDSAAAIEKNR
jgi:hypothetical protein